MQCLSDSVPLEEVGPIISSDFWEARRGTIIIDGVLAPVHKYARCMNGIFFHGNKQSSRIMRLENTQKGLIVGESIMRKLISLGRFFEEIKKYFSICLFLYVSIR